MKMGMLARRSDELLLQKVESDPLAFPRAVQEQSLRR
jgi:hypothetical protein